MRAGWVAGVLGACLVVSGCSDDEAAPPEPSVPAMALLDTAVVETSDR